MKRVKNCNFSFPIWRNIGDNAFKVMNVSPPHASQWATISNVMSHGGKATSKFNETCNNLDSASFTKGKKFTKRRLRTNRVKNGFLSKTFLMGFDILARRHAKTIFVAFPTITVAIFTVNDSTNENFFTKVWILCFRLSLNKGSFANKKGSNIESASYTKRNELYF